MRKAFITTAAVHVVNLKSIESLRQSIIEKYSEESPNNIPRLDFDYNLFRPNIVIDYDEPFSEELIYQSRIENIMMR